MIYLTSKTKQIATYNSNTIFLTKLNDKETPIICEDWKNRNPG